MLSLFPRFIPFSAFYPFFRVLSLFPRFIPFSAFYPFFRVLSLFPRFIPFSASAIPYFRNSGSVFYPNSFKNYLFIYLLNFAIHTDINKWQGHHNSVHQLLWALLKLSNPVNLRIQLNLSQYNITRYNTIRYNTCTIQYITTEYNIIARTRFNSTATTATSSRILVYRANQLHAH